MAEESPIHGQMTIIEVQAIDPSPFQRRQHFEEEKLKAPAASIQRDGLIEPIVVRPSRERYQLISGERRWRAVRDYTDNRRSGCDLIYMESHGSYVKSWPTCDDYFERYSDDQMGRKRDPPI